MKKYLTLFLTVVLFAGLTACTKNDVSEKNGVENKDKPFTINYLGQEYSFDKKAENIVLASLEGMEDAATLGVEAKGVLEVAGKVPKYLEENFKSATLVGDKMNPNSEVILGLNPNVIIGSSKFGEEVMNKLNKIAVTLPYSHISANWKDNLLALGEIMGKTDVANKLISDYEEKASKTKEELSSEYKDKDILVIRIRRGLMYVYPADVYLNPVLYTDLGIKVPGIITNSKAQAELTIETLAEINPDAIFLQFDNSENTDSPEALNQLLENPIFKSIEASKNNKVFVNTVDPLAQGGTAWSKVRFLDAVVDNLLK
ncbi:MULTISPECIES: ABC transporter substrate-binding protein [unclassified Clostridium]|uniref:ABC transporter substrate-binding protein n=1 Tax=unclassified Clostridium TaxID=2614128 RepID=UPI0013F07197|nr:MULTISPECIES: ABC transporter substrate-binding protein [unclassified Clostridium]NFG61130.1 iron-uptake system-binding protein [Clostridium botulinum]NFQ08876.1 iron-uptake system-binding protein [Clostridium botulinum]